MSTRQKVTFASILDKLAEHVPAYRQIVFQTILLGMVIGKCRRRHLP